MEKIIWENYDNKYEMGTQIPPKIYGVFAKLHEAGIIEDIVLNAELFNKIHPEILFQKLNWDIAKIGEEVKKILEE